MDGAHLCLTIRLANVCHQIPCLFKAAWSIVPPNSIGALTIFMLDDMHEVACIKSLISSGNILRNMSYLGL